MDLDAIKARAEAATEGPWSRHDFGYAGEQEPSSIVIHTGAFDHAALIEGETHIASLGWDSQADADAVFIARARTDVPELVAEVERLRAVLTRTDEADGSVIDILEAERDTLRAQRDAVLGLHAPFTVEMFAMRDLTWCGGCERGKSWPCATVRALGVTE